MYANQRPGRTYQNLTFNGKPIDPKATFLIATNNYRAYSGKFAGTGDSHIAFASPDENRAVLSAYISAETKKKGQVIPQADNNWRLAILDSKQPLDIRFETSPTAKAADFIKQKRNTQWKHRVQMKLASPFITSIYRESNLWRQRLTLYAAVTP